MAIRRNVVQKTNQQTDSAAVYTYSLPVDGHKKRRGPAPAAPAASPTKVDQIFGYSVQLIYQDIAKTIIVFLLVLVALGIIIRITT